MPLAVFECRLLDGRHFCDRCNCEKENVRFIKWNLTDTIQICYDCFWKRFPFGIVIVGANDVERT